MIGEDLIRIRGFNMFSDWNFWLSVVTATIAIAALIQSQQQIRLSNKQLLFDKRVENYIIALGLMQLYKSNCFYIEQKGKDEPYYAIDYMFALMTNNSYLEQITPAIKNPLEPPCHKEFLIKLEDIKDVSTKLKFLFSGTASVMLGDFVFCYQELLYAMYQYEIFMKKSKALKSMLDQLPQKSGEKQQRLKLQTAIDNLKQAGIMLKMENVEEQINKQIKL